jgi:uncharacterized short protein YbdD (DUF466 family)
MRTPVPSTVTGHPDASLRIRVQRALRVIRSIIGAPDYERYVAHMASHHPGCAVMPRDEFMQQRLESRYSRPGSRCC